MVEVGTIITIAIVVIIIGIIGFFIYKRRFGGAALGRGPKRYQRMTREGEPLEDYRGEGGVGLISRSSIRIVIPVIIGLILLVVVLSASIKIVDAGHRGVLLNFGAVDTSASLNEGIHFVVPFRDNIVQLEVRTQKIVENAASASRDLQDVSTQVAVNYHINPATAQLLFQQLGFDYANRVIAPAIQESVKQVTARYNAENLITNRETVKDEIENQILLRLAAFNVDVEALSITEFQFSEQFRRAVEAKVEAEAINIVEAQLRENPRYLEWLKTQRWDGVLPLVTSGSEGATPFIEIPTSRADTAQEAGTAEGGSNNTAASTPSTAAAAGNSTQAAR